MSEISAALRLSGMMTSSSSPMKFGSAPGSLWSSTTSVSVPTAPGTTTGLRDLTKVLGAELTELRLVVRVKPRELAAVRVVAVLAVHVHPAAKQLGDGYRCDPCPPSRVHRLGHADVVEGVVREPGAVVAACAARTTKSFAPRFWALLMAS